MDISYNYIKVRKNFGKQPMFCETPVQMLDSIEPNVSEQKKYGLRNPVHHEMQATLPVSEHYVNTKRITYQDQGINHAEGGWPKEIHFDDEELTSRLRRRVERDDSYVDAVLTLCPKLERSIKQNNAIEMYNMYFKGLPPVQPIEKYSLRVDNAYKDPNNRPVACLGWTFEDNSKLVVAYCNKKYPILSPVNTNFTCFFWDLENPLSPSMEFTPPSACWQVACSPVNPTVVIGGLEDGTVCIFDIRAKTEPVNISPMHLAHRDPVTSLIYMQSRLNTEFFSGSTDGSCMWWDVRNISNPIETMIMSIRIPPGQPISLANSEGISVLQFERTFPTRFLCGTDTGFVINVNRKGKSYQEVMSAVFNAHKGPVRALHRSPCTSKMFITCGDWTVNIWSDDVHTSPIITGMPHRCQINDVVWAPQRVSSYMSVGADGKFRYWDLLRKYREPLIILPVTKTPLLKIKPHDEGRLVAVGDAKGVMYLLSLSESLTVSGEKDKQLMMQTYERETRREHILETRVKEIRLKTKADEGVPLPVETVDEEALIKSAEDEYRKVVTEEIRRAGIVSSGGGSSAMRRR